MHVCLFRTRKHFLRKCHCTLRICNLRTCKVAPHFEMRSLRLGLSCVTTSLQRYLLTKNTVDPRCRCVWCVDKRKVLTLPGLASGTLVRAASTQSPYRLRFPRLQIHTRREKRLTYALWISSVGSFFVSRFILCEFVFVLCWIYIADGHFRRRLFPFNTGFVVDRFLCSTSPAAMTTICSNTA